MTPPFRIEPLGEQDRSTFSCGEEALDRYLKTQASQDARRRVANCFVVVETASARLAAFYTIAATSIPIGDLPASVAKRLPRYPVVPAVRLGRLAVDRQFHGRKLEGAMLVDAVRRTIAAGPAAFAIVVDAKSEEAAAFYQHHGFEPIVERPLALFVPLATAEALLLKG